MLTYADAGKYVGEYKDGTLTGHGVMTWADGKRYEGQVLTLLPLLVQKYKY
jgi:hypothetical protein